LINNNENKNISSFEKFISKKGVFTQLLILIAFTILLCYAVFNLPSILSFLKRVITLFKPVIYGFCIAYIINIFLVLTENLWDKIFIRKKSRFKLKRSICLIVSIILVIGILSTVLFMIIPKLTETVYDMVNSLPMYFEKTEKFLGAMLDKFNIKMPEFNIDTKKLQTELTKIIPKIGTNFVNTTVNITSSIFSGVFNFVISIVFALYMLIQKENLCLALKKILFALFKKKNADSAMKCFSLTNQTFTKFITGQLTEAVIIGVLCFLGMLFLRIPYAFIISVLVGFTALIPVFGAFIGTFIGAFLIVMESPLKALWFIIFIIVLQQLEGNLIYPKVVGKSVGLPGILVLAAVTIGGSAFGVVGMLVSVPSVSVVYVLINQAVENQITKKKIEFKTK